MSPRPSVSTKRSCTHSNFLDPQTVGDYVRPTKRTAVEVNTRHCVNLSHTQFTKLMPLRKQTCAFARPRRIFFDGSPLNSACQQARSLRAGY